MRESTTVYSRRCELPCGQRFGGALSLRQIPSGCQGHSWGHPIPSPSRADLQRAVGGCCTSPRPITASRQPMVALWLALLGRRGRRRRLVVPSLCAAPSQLAASPLRSGSALRDHRRHLGQHVTPGLHSHSPTRTFISPPVAWRAAQVRTPFSSHLISGHKPGLAARRRVLNHTPEARPQHPKQYPARRCHAPALARRSTGAKKPPTFFGHTGSPEHRADGAHPMLSLHSVCCRHQQ
jgi:hypothetical protein